MLLYSKGSAVFSKAVEEIKPNHKSVFKGISRIATVVGEREIYLQ